MFASLFASSRRMTFYGLLAAVLFSAFLLIPQFSSPNYHISKENSSQKTTPNPHAAFTTSRTAKPILQPSDPSDTLVVYVYYDGTMTDQDSRLRYGWGYYLLGIASYFKAKPTQPDNLAFFLRQGLLSNVDHLFIMNSPVPKGVPMPQRDNIFVWERKNSCYDLGSFHLGVQRMQETHNRTYKRYILLNASVRGPFLPTHNHACWTDSFLNFLSDDIKLVGTTYFCDNKDKYPAHVQSMVLAFDEAGYEAGLPAFQCSNSIKDAIMSGEVRLTGLLQEKGFKAHSITTAYAADPDACENGDMNYKGKYYGMSYHPYELVFIKTNRDIDDLALKQYTEWHDKIIARGAGSCPYHIPLWPSTVQGEVS